MRSFPFRESSLGATIAVALLPGCGTAPLDTSSLPDPHVFRQTQPENNPIQLLSASLAINTDNYLGASWQQQNPSLQEALTQLAPTSAELLLCLETAENQHLKRIWKLIEQNKLSPAAAATMLGLFSCNPFDLEYANAVETLCGSKILSSLNEKQIAQIGVIFSRLPHSSTQVLFAKLTQTDYFGTNALKLTDAGGTCLLSNLYELTCTNNIHPDLLEKRAGMVVEMIQLISRDEAINQGHKRVCGTATSLNACQRWSEYLRLLLGLISPEGTVIMAGGGQLKRVPDSIEPDESWRIRGTAMRLLMAALHDFGNSEDWEYTNFGDKNKRGIFSFPGLMPAAQQACMEQLTGKPHRVTWSIDTTLKALEKAELKGERIAVVLITDGPSFHWVAPLAFKEGEIYSVEPQGKRGMNKNEISYHLGAKRPCRAMSSSYDNSEAIFSFELSVFRENFLVAVIPVD